MSKAKKTGFKKGYSGNPKGRPKGSFSPLRQQLMDLRKRAAANADEAYDRLWQDFQAGDPLAKQIFFKELLSVPKEWLNEVDTSDLPKQIRSVDDVNHVLAALANTLLNGESMSTEEVHSLIKTLNNIKFTEQFGKQNNVLSKLSDEQIKIIVGWLEEADKTTNEKKDNEYTTYSSTTH